MSLNWSIAKVENWKAKKEKEPNVLETLIWATMIIGVNEITQKNYFKFYARIRQYEDLFGAFLFKGNKSYPITLEHVKNWVGLHTNASNYTATQFEKKVIDRLKEKTEG